MIWETVGAQGPSGESLASQKSLLASRDAVDLLLIDLGNDLHRSRRSHPEQDIGGTRDLADLAVAPQHHAVERSSQQQRVEVRLLRGDPRFCFLELGPALLVLGARGVVLVAILLGARQIAFELAAIDFHLIERAALLGVVLAAETWPA